MGQRSEWTEAQGGRVEGLLRGKPGTPGRTRPPGCASTRYSGGYARGPASAPSRRAPGSGRRGPQRVTRGAQAGVWARGVNALTTERGNEYLPLDRPLVRAPQPTAPGKGGAG